MGEFKEKQMINDCTSVNNTPSILYIRHSFIFLFLYVLFWRTIQGWQLKQRQEKINLYENTHLFLRLINFWCPKAFFFFFMVQKMKMKIFCPSLFMMRFVSNHNRIHNYFLFIIQKSPFHTTTKHLSVILQSFVCL